VIDALRASWQAGARASLQALVWRHPHWWVYAGSASCWMILLGVDSRDLQDLCRAPGSPSAVAWLSQLPWLACMVVAMMLPLAAGAVRHAACRSRWTWRHRAGLSVVVGYTAAWLLALWLFAGVLLAASPIDSRLLGYAATCALIVGAAWQWSEARKSALRACHRTVPLSPQGWQCAAGCLSYGWRQGCQCIIVCWPQMLAMMLGGSHGILMPALAGIAIGERLYLGPVPLRVSAALLALAAVAMASTNGFVLG
jgi:predicted metal-binding membrane protein